MMNIKKKAQSRLLSAAIVCMLANSGVLANEETSEATDTETTTESETTDQETSESETSETETSETETSETETSESETTESETSESETSESETSESETTESETTETPEPLLTEPDVPTVQNYETDNEGEDQIIAIVNGQGISARALERVTDQLSAQGQNPDRSQIIQELINLEILTQEAERLGLDNNVDVATALQLQYTQTMANAYLGQFSRDLRIGEDEIRAEYEAQIAAIKVSEYNASHILLENETDALKVIDELAAGGNFAVLAETYSTGPTGVKGGDLGWFQPENMEPEFADAVSNLQKGETTTEPVKTKFGWHVIQLTDTRSAAKPDYSPTVKAGIQNTLLRDAMAAKVDELRSAATIEMP